MQKSTGSWPSHHISLFICWLWACNEIVKGWHLVCTYRGQVVLIFPGVVNAFRLVPERGEMGFCWKGLTCEPLSIFSGLISVAGRYLSICELLRCISNTLKEFPGNIT